MALWTPELITTALWLDASDASTVAESGGAVSQWDDKSGNERHLLQASGGSQPTIADNKISSDGTKFMAATPATVAFAEHFLIAAVFDVSTVTSYTRPPFLPDNGTNSGRPVDRWHYSSSNGLIIDGYTVADASTVNLRVASSPRIHVMIGQKDAVSSGTHTVWERLNGNASYTGSRTKTWSTAGQAFRLFRRSDGATALNGWVSEIVCLDQAASQDDIDKIEGYLAWKWGLEANLPSGHPYELAAPSVSSVSGTITDDTGTPCARTVRLYDRATGAFIAETTSDASTGAYDFSYLPDDEVQRIVLDDSDGTLYNDLIDRVIPG